MEISNKPPNIDLAYFKRVQERLSDKDDAAAGAKNAGASDVVALSSTARDLQRAGKALQDVPDVRQEKVDRIRRQIENGTYEIDSVNIARQMLKESIFNDIPE